MNKQASQNEHGFEELQKGAEAMQPLNEEEQAHIKGGSNPIPTPNQPINCAQKYLPQNVAKYKACQLQEQKCAVYLDNKQKYDQCMAGF